MPDPPSDTPDLASLQIEAVAAVSAATDLDALEGARVAFTGKKSPLSTVQRSMGGLTPDGRKELGQQLNAFKAAFEDAYAARHAELQTAALDTRLAGERLDLSLPPRRVSPGRPHLLTQVEREIIDVLVGMGYDVAEGPEIEAAIYAFDLLNIPADHPARQQMDTIYVDDPTAATNGHAPLSSELVLRPHTSPVQARTMLALPAPIAIAAPGRVYRQDTPDATHSPVFTQVEGLVVAPGITMADLRGTLLAFSRAMFGPDREIRLRPSFFPFTEPSAEVDVTCGFCTPGDTSCRVCSGTNWIEILGSGMVDPAVLEACGHDPAVVSGFAFGIGVERVAMLRHGIRDIRDFFEGDARFSAQF